MTAVVVGCLTMRCSGRRLASRRLQAAQAHIDPPFQQAVRRLRAAADCRR